MRTPTQTTRPPARATHPRHGGRRLPNLRSFARLRGESVYIGIGPRSGLGVAVPRLGLTVQLGELLRGIAGHIAKAAMLACHGGKHVEQLAGRLDRLNVLAMAVAEEALALALQAEAIGVNVVHRIIGRQLVEPESLVADGRIDAERCDGVRRAFDAKLDRERALTGAARLRSVGHWSFLLARFGPRAGVVTTPPAQSLHYQYSPLLAPSQPRVPIFSESS